MTFLDWDVLDLLDGGAFRAAKPYPWANPAGALTEEGRRALLSAMPDDALFTKTFGMERSYGQMPHDRWELLHHDGLALPAAWHAFIAELKGPRYRAFVARVFGRKDFVLRFQWQRATRGCSVSPHCDGLRKIGSHLFYLNDASDWDLAWGGATLVLDDDGKLDFRSSPDFAAFKREIAAETFGNRSFIFARGDHAWHGVRPLTCPEGKMRRIFSVVVDKRPPLKARFKTALKKLFRIP